MKPFSRKACTALVAALALSAVPVVAAQFGNDANSRLDSARLIRTVDGSYLNQDGQVVLSRTNQGLRVVAPKGDTLAQTDAQSMRGARAVQFDGIARLSVGQAVSGYFVNPNGSSVEVVEQNNAKWSGNGQYIVFPSAASNLISGDTNDRMDVFRLDVTTDEVVRLSTTYGLTGEADGSEAFTGDPNSRAGAYAPTINNDGTKVAFWSNLVLNDVHNSYVFPAVGSIDSAPASEATMLYWIQLDGSGATTDMKLVTNPGASLPDFNMASTLFAGCDMDSSGDLVAFVSDNQNLPGAPIFASQFGGVLAQQIYVWDSNANSGAGQAYLISDNSIGNPLAILAPNGGAISLSDDGTKVSFMGWGNETITGRTDSPYSDMFAADVTTLASPGDVVRIAIPDGVVPSFANNPTQSNDMGDFNAYGMMSPDGNMVAYYGDAENGVVTGNDVPPESTSYLLGHLYVKTVFGANAGDLVCPVRNENYDLIFSTGYSGSMDYGTRITWSGDQNWVSFGADWDVRSNQTAPPVGGAFPNIGLGVWIIDTATWSTVEQRFVDESPEPSPINDGNRAPYALSLGPTSDLAAFVVGDGVTFPGDSGLAEDLAIYDNTQAVGSKMSRAGALPLTAPDTNDLSGRPAMSDDGNYVAYVTFAENVVGDDSNGVPEVVLFDRATSTNILLSRDPANPGTQADNSSGGAVNLGSADFELELTGTGGSSVAIWHSVSSVDMSSDGRYVVFPSGASNLGASGFAASVSDVSTALGAGGTDQIYLYDTTAGTIKIVTEFGPVGASYEVADDVSFNPVVSDNGQYVAFQTYATNLVGASGGGGFNIVRRDMTVAPDDPNAYVLVSDLGAGEMSATENVWPQISADGTLVCWMSLDNMLADDDTNGITEYDIYLWTEGSGISLVSGTDGGVRYTVNDGGNSTSYDSIRPVMSNDGSFITFVTLASFDPLDPQPQGDVAGSDNDEYDGPFWDIYIYNTATQTCRVVDPGLDMSTPDAFRWTTLRSWAKSDNAGRVVVFQSLGKYASADTNEHYDIYAFDRFTNSMTILSRNAAGVASDDDVVPFADTGRVQFSVPFLNSDGTKVAFDSQASNLVADDGNGHRDVFLVDLSLTSTGVTEVENSWDMYQ
ncbi:hypothetical protein KQI84_05325 [bacterium]|nr:hypothetical protein [bacterium]